MADNNKPTTEPQPAPTGMFAWVGFGCCVMSLACLSISFCSPYWIQTWANSQNQFHNMGLWEVCFSHYMQFKDDSQQIYDGCWWVFDRQAKYYKLREWLTPPWFISCQVLTTGCLMVEVATCLVTATIFLHCCPVMNHEYLQTYGIFASASMMFLVTMTSLVVATLFAVQTNDRFWMPRPDQNYLSWGFGFLIITAIFSLASGVVLYMEAQKTYKALLQKEDEYTKAALDMTAIPLQQSFPPAYEPDYGPSAGYDSQYGAGMKERDYADSSYGQMKYAPNYGPRDMDSDVLRKGRLLDIIDKDWREDKLPHEDIAVPHMELPELEPDNGNTNETLSEQDQKWTDLGLGNLHDASSQS